MVDRLSTIGAGLRVDGHLVGDGDLEVHGHFEGSIHIGGSLHVALGAVVRADVLAARIEVAGQLIGPVRATREIRVLSSGELQGAIQGQLLVDDGGVYRGHMTPGRVRPQKTVNTRRRVPPPKVVSEADRRTEGSLPSVPPDTPVAAGRSLRGAAPPSPPPGTEDQWFGPAGPRRARTPGLEITEGEPPPQSVTGIPALSPAQVALRLGDQHAPAPTGEIPPPREDPLLEDLPEADPTELPSGPSRLSIPNPPRRRTTEPGVAPFRQSFGGALRAPAPPIPPPAVQPRPASVSGRAVPVVRPRHQTDPGTPAHADADLSDSWFLPDDEDV